MSYSDIVVRNEGEEEKIELKDLSIGDFFLSYDKLFVKVGYGMENKDKVLKLGAKKRLKKHEDLLVEPVNVDIAVRKI